MALARLSPDSVVGNRFRLVRELGSGAMGCVWVAKHLTLGVDVAVKFIDGSLLHNAAIRGRFAQEAMAAAQIRSRHVVQVLDYGAGDADMPYIAMELLHGEDLAARIRRLGQLPLQDVHRLVTQTCKGLAKAHAAGIIHRDIKPENLFIVEDEEEDGFLVKILDFGVAKAELLGINRTETGALMGTPLYMSPEQAIGAKVDHRTDLYSLATVAYHCLAGRPPFDGSNLAMLVLAVTSQSAAGIRAFRPDLSPDVEQWLATCMNKDRTRRFPTAREMAQAFARIAAPRNTDFVEWSAGSIRVADILAAQKEREEEVASTLPWSPRSGSAHGVEILAPAAAGARSSLVVNPGGTEPAGAGSSLGRPGLAIANIRVAPGSPSAALAGGQPGTVPAAAAARQPPAPHVAPAHARAATARPRSLLLTVVLVFVTAAATTVIALLWLLPLVRGR